MGKVVFDMSMSLDGFVRATGYTAEEGLGKGGERLHDWALGADPAGTEILAAAQAEAAAGICGRGTYDTSLRWWGADGPTGSLRRPLVVVTHQAPADVPPDNVYTFVTDGVESAVRQAKALAGDKSVFVMGPDVGCQLIRAGLVDEIGVHVVPVLFGAGLRFFESLGDGHVNLEILSVRDTPLATHIVYRVVK